jgi:hypothetical protein
MTGTRVVPGLKPKTPLPVDPVTSTLTDANRVTSRPLGQRGVLVVGTGVEQLPHRAMQVEGK